MQLPNLGAGPHKREHMKAANIRSDTRCAAISQGSTFRKKSWGQLASKFSFLVARTSILVAKNYLQEKIAYNILKVFLTSTKSSISYLLQNRLHNPYNGTCYKIHFYAFMYSVTVKLTDS